MYNKISVLEEALDLLKDKMLSQHKLSRIGFHYAIEALEEYLESQKQSYYYALHYDDPDDAYDAYRDVCHVDYC